MSVSRIVLKTKLQNLSVHFAGRLRLAEDPDRFGGESRYAGAAGLVNVLGELAAAAVQLAELGEDLVRAAVVVLGDVVPDPKEKRDAALASGGKL